MTTDQNLMLYTKLAGFRLVVLANRFGCDDDFSRQLHDRLVEGVDAAIDRIHVIMALERSVLIGDDEFAEFQLEGENEIFGSFAITLLDDLEFDCDTHEFRVNGGDWMNALAADHSGVDIDYPKLVALSADELGSLAAIIRDITSETGIAVHAARALQSWR
ncbi:LOW QUALITY PROTEIN: hypothetical protein Rleg4DRAFT_4681 [Rhizobium leguminosarum bv. trifolii WSM2297]|uniref:Uncharacterized protein n=1 Tax=Rhizobium leguminosarum bv. trifolii WSM2297 TaxID=754762 RepID=J0WCK9_RHILT|nr:LOW QUALITY PROTEIN: hypothetical protein Rleg4DRAFT_4681 [Rhizobium leguminosarum bv. trifolii WSM2297]